MLDSIKTKKEILAERAIRRADSGLYFLKECLAHIHRGGTDAAYSRSMYILFSYNFELILKSRLLLASSSTDIKELIKEIKSHDLDGLSKKLSKDELNDINVNSIQRKEDSGFIEYVIELTDGNKVTLQDLIDVRYDFDKDILRNIDQDESNTMQNDIETLLRMTEKINRMLEKKVMKKGLHKYEEKYMQDMLEIQKQRIIEWDLANFTEQVDEEIFQNILSDDLNAKQYEKVKAIFSNAINNLAEKLLQKEKNNKRTRTLYIIGMIGAFVFGVSVILFS